MTQRARPSSSAVGMETSFPRVESFSSTYPEPPGLSSRDLLVEMDASSQGKGGGGGGGRAGHVPGLDRAGDLGRPAQPGSPGKPQGGERLGGSSGCWPGPAAPSVQPRSGARRTPRCPKCHLASFPLTLPPWPSPGKVPPGSRKTRRTPGAGPGS